jgi:F-type H+-transporting ATPase subunit delta
MTNPQAARRYARALFELADEQQIVEKVRDDLVALADLLARPLEQTALSRLHALSAEDRKTLFQALFEGRLEPLTLRFLVFLVDKGRNNLAREIIDAFLNLYNERKGILAVRVVAAHPLETAQVESITRRLKSRWQKEVQATVQVDPELLGGFQIRVGDQVHDYTLQHQLDLARRRLATA